MFAALLRALAQKVGWGLPNFGSVCSQLEVPETGVDLRVWRRQGSAACGDENESGERRRRDQVGVPKLTPKTADQGFGSTATSMRAGTPYEECGAANRYPPESDRASA